VTVKPPAITILTPATRSGLFNMNPGEGGAWTSAAASPIGTWFITGDLGGLSRSKDRGRTWEVLGTANAGLGARTHFSAVACDPTNSNVVFVGTERAIYRSNDGGDNFIITNVTNNYTTAIAVAKANPTIVYACVHTSNTTLDGAIYKSTDGGLTFSSMGAPAASLRLLKVIVHPLDANRVMTLHGDDGFVSVTDSSLWLSTNGGTSWAQQAASLVGDAGDLIWDCAFHPADTSRAYITIREDDPANPGNPSFWTGELCHTTDGGDNWSRVTPSAVHTGTLFIREDQPNIIRTIDIERFPASGGTHKSGVWEYDSTASTWTKKLSGMSFSGHWQGTADIDLSAAHGKNIYGFAKSTAPNYNDPDSFFLIGAQFAYTCRAGGTIVDTIGTDAVGSAWRGRGLDNVVGGGLAASETTSGKVYLGYWDLGLWVTTDKGQSSVMRNAGTTTEWDNGTHGGNCNSIVCDPTTDGKLWACIGSPSGTGLNVYYSTNDGANWTKATGMTDGFVRGISLARSSSAGSRVMLVTAGGDVYKSTDDGVTWAVTLTQATAGGALYTTAIDPADANLMYAGGIAGVWRSTNGGTAWSNISATNMAGAASGSVQGEVWNGVHTIITHPTLANAVYVAAFGGAGLRGVWKSTNTGTDWTKIRTGDRWRHVAVDSINSNIIYIASSELIKGGGDNTKSEGVLYTTDGGTNWKALMASFPLKGVGRVVVNPVDRRELYLNVVGQGFMLYRWPITPR